MTTNSIQDLNIQVVQSKLQSGAEKFSYAVNSKDRRLELLEEAFHEYVEIIPYLNKLPEDIKNNVTSIVLKRIHNIEQMLEIEINIRTQKLYT
jgi:hypothetical protein